MPLPATVPRLSAVVVQQSQRCQEQLQQPQLRQPRPVAVAVHKAVQGSVAGTALGVGLQPLVAAVAGVPAVAAAAPPVAD